MDINFWFGFLGLVIGVVGIWITIILNNKVSLTIACLDNYSLFNSFNEKSDSISITYKNSAIDKNLIYLKFCIINDGRIDIDKLSVSEPITLHFPEQCTVLEATKISNNHMSTVELIDDKNVVIKWDLLKIKEYLSFEVLVNSNEEKLDVYDKIKISQRITNLKETKKIKMKQEKPDSYFAFMWSQLIGIIGFSSFIFLLVYFSITKFDSYLHPTLKLETVNSYNSKNIELKLLNSSHVQIIADKKSIDTLQLSDIKNKIKLTPVVSVDRTNLLTPILILLGLFILLFAARGLLSESIFEFKKDKINRIIQ